MAQHETPIEEQFVQFPMLAFTDLPDFSEAELKVLLYVTRQIKNYPGVTWRVLSTDEIQHGRKRQDGSRMDRGTGLSNRAVIDAIRRLALRKHLFPAAESSGQKSYALIDCPPLTDGSPMKKVHRQNQEEAPPVKIVHSTYEESSQGDVKKVHSTGEDYSQEAADEASLQQARREVTDTLGDTYSTDTWRDTRAPAEISKAKREDEDEPASADTRAAQSRSPAVTSTPLGARVHAPATEELGNHAPGKGRADTAAALDVDALAQRKVAHQALQKLLAEQEQLAALLPSQRGWGAAQGRLRAIAREMDYLQAQATPPAPAASPAEPEAAGAADPAVARRSQALPRPQRDNDPPEPEQDTRWHRLKQLQSELAHLKRTPSMQLMARQRIPRLEAEIKQLIAAVQERA